MMPELSKETKYVIILCSLIGMIFAVVTLIFYVMMKKTEKEKTAYAIKFEKATKDKEKLTKQLADSDAAKADAEKKLAEAQENIKALYASIDSEKNRNTETQASIKAKEDELTALRANVDRMNKSSAELKEQQEGLITLLKEKEQTLKELNAYKEESDTKLQKLSSDLKEYTGDKDSATSLGTLVVK